MDKTEIKIWNENEFIDLGNNSQAPEVPTVTQDFVMEVNGSPGSEPTPKCQDGVNTITEGNDLISEIVTEEHVEKLQESILDETVDLKKQELKKKKNICHIIIIAFKLSRHVKSEEHVEKLNETVDLNTQKFNKKKCFSCYGLGEIRPNPIAYQSYSKKWVVLVSFFYFMHNWLWIFTNTMKTCPGTTSVDCVDVPHLQGDRETSYPRHLTLFIWLLFLMLVMTLFLGIIIYHTTYGILIKEGSMLFNQNKSSDVFDSKFSNSFCGENLKTSHKWYLNWSLKALRGLQRDYCTFPVNHPGSLEKYFIERLKVSELSLKGEMKYEWKRFQSFSSWPDSVPVFPSDLAKEGFYYSNKDEGVICFSCNLKISSINTGKSITIEHRSMSPNCKFLLKQEENIPIFEKEEELATHNVNVAEMLPDASWLSVKDQTDSLLVNPSDAELLSVRTAVEVPKVFLDRMKQETLRITTYRKWPLRDTVDVREMTKAGFFYLGTESQVRCAFCPVTLQKIRPTDNPMDVHRRLNPHCPAVNTIREEPERSTSLPLPPTQNDRLLDDTASSLGIIEDSPKHPEYSTLQSRLHSFSNWNPSSRQIPKDLAEAGFMYAGMRDCVKCYHCDGGLRNWLPGDVPWVEHARWFPRCSHVRLNKGQRFIDTVNDVFPRNTTSIPSTPASTSVRNDIPGNTAVVPTQSAVSTNNIDKSMSLPAVQTVLDMGFSRNVVKDALQKHFMEQGNGVRWTAQTLLDIILEVSENELGSGASVTETAHLGNPPITANFVEVADAANSDSSEFNPSDSTDTKALREKNRELVEQTLCKICLENKMCITFLPCGHLVSCSGCAPALKKCPICRSNIKGRVRVYMS